MGFVAGALSGLGIHLLSNSLRRVSLTHSKYRYNLEHVYMCVGFAVLWKEAIVVLMRVKSDDEDFVMVCGVVVGRLAWGCGGKD